MGSAYWFAGRQVVTAERLELHALCTEARFDDGLPFSEVLQRIRTADAVSVTSWGVGKWLFGRGGIVRRGIEEALPGELLLSDSSLRPRGLPESGLFALARGRGLGILAGTDPLPFAGQEQLIGTFGCILPNFDPTRPLQSVKEMLRVPNASFEFFGQRSSPFEVARRLFKARQSKERASHQSQRATG